ncbi:FAD-binding oxidoreductase [Candidatus Saccharibacteria bacterium]|nr:FAD-binding oxidoreductase [Candidatus Saccharibacteria bacterium]
MRTISAIITEMRLFVTSNDACAIIEAKHTNFIEDGRGMNKIAAYLNEHLLGEVTSSKAMRRRYSRDGSVLSITPEIIAFPRITNDIRKVARFSWQLAEKGHPLGLTIRGMGSDTTGGAIGKGMILSTSAHLNNILTVLTKDRLVQVQPGVTFEALNHALKWQGLALANSPRNERFGTIGGAIATNALGDKGEVADAIEKLEVVLANGDLIETGRISKHDLNKKLGLQTFEGEIYRKIEGLLEDNDELIKQLASDQTRDNVGYKGIALVKEKDGSFDITPLFVGSQGTLGIISEVVLKAQFYKEQTIAIAVVEDAGMARDITDRLIELGPSVLRTIDGELFRRAAELGAKASLLGSVEAIGTVIYIEFNDTSDRAQLGKLKKMRKLLNKLSVGMIDSSDHQIDEFKAVAHIGDSLYRAGNDDAIALPIIDGAFVPAGRREAFTESLAELSSKLHIALPLSTNVLTGTIDAYPVLKLDVMGDKQKLFRLISDYADLVTKSDGAFISDGGEGRLKANAAWATITDDEAHLYEQVRATFDPFGTLNPDVKQKNDVRSLVASLRTSYDASDFVS